MAKKKLEEILDLCKERRIIGGSHWCTNNYTDCKYQSGNCKINMGDDESYMACDYWKIEETNKKVK